MKFGKWTFVGFLFDLADWLCIGLIPGIGELLDVIAIIVWWRILGPVALIDAIELIPAVDLLPTNVAFGVYADSNGKE